MTRWRVLVLVLSLAACTKPNPRSCADGTCTDPAFPFCDVGGELEGTPQTCIAVACEPGEFNGCRGDQELRCNTEGTNFDLVQCDLGCDDLIGCRLCEPNETACTNGTVATCDAAGAVVDSRACPLDCFEDEPRCREMVPSNGLVAVLDSFPDAPDLDLSAGGSINTTTGAVTSGDTTFVLPTLLHSQGVNPPIRVLVVGALRLGNVTITSDPLTPGAQSPSLAILANREIEIVGTVRVAAGDLVTGPCVGGIGHVLFNEATQNPDTASGSGGGGHATAGGNGGNGNGTLGGAKGTSSGMPALVPLLGGCASGGADDNGEPFTAIGVRGGGALQLSSRVSIKIAGAIDARGEPGFSMQTFVRGLSLGGGGGGGVLLEAPTVDITAEGKVLAKGGDGYGCAAPDVCAHDQVSYGGPGLAATATSPATNGQSSTAQFGTGGGGGGGLGRIRINTKDSTFATTSASTVEGDLTTSTIETR